MDPRSKKTLAFLAIVSLFLVSPGSSQDKFKLKPGAKGKLCLNCHDKVADALKLPHVHTPVKAGDCTDCHNPHDSSHGKLLEADPTRICNKCHAGVVPEQAKSTHKVAAEGNCIKCHDPHAARNKNNLLLAGNELCFGCHKELAKAVSDVQFKHNPVVKGCTTCHNPHASSTSEFLLGAGVTSLCTKCHASTTPSFARQHMNYPVAKGRCTSCHDPHGSGRAGMLWDGVHAPVANKRCNQCHLDPSAPDALKTKRPGFELCRGCHNTTMNEIMGKNRIHWPLVDKASCSNCHNPHASKQKSLLTAPMKTLCGSCHQDAVERQAKSVTKHPPIEQGNCTRCHSPHAANNAFLFDNASTISLCGSCHEWQKHSSHPIGEKVVDPRNRNIGLDCASCHRSHGTDQKSFTHFSAKMDLCVQCHEKLGR